MFEVINMDRFSYADLIITQCVYIDTRYVLVIPDTRELEIGRMVV
jgi:hypothetical protein